MTVIQKKVPQTKGVKGTIKIKLMVNLINPDQPRGREGKGGLRMFFHLIKCLGRYLI